jgi:hypothetical protein
MGNRSRWRHRRITPRHFHRSGWRELARPLRFEPLESRNLLATITVNSLLDNGDGANTTLREAITSSASGDTIVFSVTGTIQLTTAGDNHIEIDNSLTIEGPGADLLTIRAHDPDGNGNNDGDGDRIFYISGSGTLNVTISGLTLTNGDPDPGDGEGESIGGGAIHNDENLTLMNCVLTDNFAGGGGAILNRSGTLQVIDCVITGNAAQDGGGIELYQSGSVTLTRTTISNNHASNSGGGIHSLSRPITLIDSSVSGNTANEHAGGIYISGSSSALLTVTNSTISGNESDFNDDDDGHGGGIYNSGGNLLITNSTISGNSSGERGGGIYSNTSSTINIRHSTITNNTAASDASGGGIRSQDNALLSHTIVAGNFRGSSRDDVDGSFTASFSLIGDRRSASVTNQGNSSIIGTTASPVNALLGPLANNGGLTLTHALLSGSPAIDAGNPIFNPANPDGDDETDDAIPFDQRGTPYSRVADGDGTGGDRIDMGAFEVPTPVPLVPEVAVTGNGEEIADGDMSPGTADGTDFGSTPQGGATVSRTFTVRNDGTGTMTLGAVSVPAGFTITDPLVTSLAPGASDTLIIQLDTATAGTKTGDVSFTTDDGDEPTFNFSITGVVTIPEVAVTGNGEEIADGDATPGAADGTDFGSTSQGGAAVSRAFTVRNDGTGTLTLGAVSVPAGFTITDPLVTSLAPGASDTLIIQLDTATAGTNTGDVSFTTNDSDEATFNFGITGVVTIPEVAVTGNGEEIADGDMSPGTADGTDFGTALQNGAAVSRTFTVRNDGTGTLTLGAVSVPAGFTITDPLVTSLAPGASDTLIIQLDTATAGTKSGDVSFTTDDGDEPTFNFSITGIVSVAAPDLPGDYNLDGGVDAADYVVWRKFFGETVSQYQEPDGDGDAMVDDGDYDVWSENFGETLPMGLGGGSGSGDAELEALTLAAEEATAPMLLPPDIAQSEVESTAVDRLTTSTAAGLPTLADALLALDLPIGADDGESLNGLTVSSEGGQPSANDAFDEYFNSIGEEGGLALLL